MKTFPIPGDKQADMGQIATIDLHEKQSLTALDSYAILCIDFTPNGTLDGIVVFRTPADFISKRLETFYSAQPGDG